MRATFSGVTRACFQEETGELEVEELHREAYIFSDV